MRKKGLKPEGAYWTEEKGWGVWILLYLLVGNLSLFLNCIPELVSFWDGALHGIEKDRHVSCWSKTKIIKNYGNKATDDKRSGTKEDFRQLPKPEDVFGTFAGDNMGKVKAPGDSGGEVGLIAAQTREESSWEKTDDKGILFEWRPQVTYSRPWLISRAWALSLVKASKSGFKGA